MTVEYIEIRPPTEEEEEIESIEEEKLERQRILDEIAEEERLQQEWERDQMSLNSENDKGKNFDIPKEAEDRDYVEYIEEDEMEEEEQTSPPLDEIIEIFEKKYRYLSHRSIKK